MAREFLQRPYFPKNVNKYIGDPTQIFMRSSWETRFAIWADKNPSVLQWGSETKVIPYVSPVDNKIHRYFVDFWVRIKDKQGQVKTYLIEIKPLSQCYPPDYSKCKRPPKVERVLEEEKTYHVNQAKWEAAKKYAKKMGYEFVVLTERELGIKK